MKFIRVLSTDKTSFLININTIQSISPKATGAGSLIQTTGIKENGQIVSDMHFNDLVSLVQRAGAEIFE